MIIKRKFQVMAATYQAFAMVTLAPLAAFAADTPQATYRSGWQQT